MYRTDNPARDWDRHCERQERRLNRFPICCECGERIQDEEYYELDEGKCVCPACLEENHRHWTEDYED